MSFKAYNLKHKNKMYLYKIWIFSYLVPNNCELSECHDLRHRKQASIEEFYYIQKLCTHHFWYTKGMAKYNWGWIYPGALVYNLLLHLNNGSAYYYYCINRNDYNNNKQYEHPLNDGFDFTNHSKTMHLSTNLFHRNN